MANKTRHRSSTSVFKLKVIEFAEMNSNRNAEREFDVNQKQIRDWKKKKAELKSLSSSCLSQRNHIGPNWKTSYTSGS